MKQSRFNQLVQQFIKLKSFESISKMFHTLGLPQVEKLTSLQKINAQLENDIQRTNHSIEELDERNSLFFGQLSTTSSLEDTKNKVGDENIIDAMLNLTQEKSLLQSQSLIIQKKLRENNENLRQIFNNKELRYYFRSEAMLEKELEKLINDVKEAMQIDHLELDISTISVVVTSSLKPDNLEKSSLEDFTQKLNHLCNSNFDYNISYVELLQNISMIVNLNYWEQIGKDQGFHEIVELKKILSNQSSMSDERTYIKLQEFSKKTFQKIFKINKDPDLIKFLQAIINNDVIGIETIAYKNELIDKINSMSNEKENYSIENIHPELTTSTISKKNIQFDDIINLYLFAKAADVVADETAIQIQKIINEFNVLDSEILQLETKLSKSKKYIQAVKIASDKKDEAYKINIETYPTLEIYIHQKHDKEKASDKAILFISEYESVQIKTELHQKKKIRNNKSLEHGEKIEQYLAVTNFAEHLKNTFTEKFLKMFKHNNPGINEDTIKSIADMLYNSKFQGSLPDSVNSTCHSNFKYNISHQDFLKKISDLVRHPHWLTLKKDGQNIQGIEALAKILHDKSLKSDKCLDLVTQKADKILKSSKMFWGNTVHLNVKKLCSAIIERNLFHLDQLSIQFDFVPNVEQFKIL